MKGIIKINGSFGEGGGQIIRTALAFSAITGMAFEIDNIRKGRCDCGLKTQHLFCVNAVKELCNARVEGALIGSTELKFFPGKIAARDLKFNIGTAGSTTLLMQSLLLPGVFADKGLKIELIGGTDVQWSMPADYFANVLVPQIKKFTYGLDVEVKRRGYFPKGGGKLEVGIIPKYKFNEFSSLQEFTKKLFEDNEEINLFERGKILEISGISHASNDLKNARVAERQKESAEKELEIELKKLKMQCPVEIKTEYADALSTGSGIALWAEFAGKNNENEAIGADSLGERGKKAEVVGEEAAKKLVEEIKFDAPVDEHLADNLVPWLGLFGKQMKVTKISNHTLTNIYVVEKFLGKVFEVDKKNNVIRRV
ncbi:MAG TPA: RNA 3'-terminal phosphate cyclase [Candidatus Nanoarchaeia archaeon]|nr:RNA 3'-terminal phosphate cyclase [Candidatus Nanoarchaeia archaeon]